MFYLRIMWTAQFSWYHDSKRAFLKLWKCGKHFFLITLWELFTDGNKMFIICFRSMEAYCVVLLFAHTNKAIFQKMFVLLWAVLSVNLIKRKQRTYIYYHNAISSNKLCKTVEIIKWTWEKKSVYRIDYTIKYLRIICMIVKCSTVS